MRGLGGLAGASALTALGSAPGAAAGDSRRAAAQAIPAEAAAFAQRALELRRRAQERGDQPYGAVVVKDGRIVGEGMSGVVTNRDPTAHAEMEAIRDACRRLQTGDLAGCEIYATSRPCRMCEAACYWARLARMHVGSPPADAGAPGYGSC
jgi:guanine deaminase